LEDVWFFIETVEEIWFWNVFNVVSKTTFTSNESTVIISELDVIEVSIDGIETWGGSEGEEKSGWWGVMLDRWNSDGFVIGFSDEGRVNFLFGGRESRIDIEPHTVDIGVFEWNIFTDVGIVSTDIISTEVIGWFVGRFPRFEEQRQGSVSNVGRGTIGFSFGNTSNTVGSGSLLVDF